DDPQVYQLIGNYLPHAVTLSMRHYGKGRSLRRAGLPDWQKSVLQMILPDRGTAIVAGLQLDRRLGTDIQRVERFVAETGLSRASYFRLKKRLPRPAMSTGTVLRGTAKLRLAGQNPP